VVDISTALPDKLASFEPESGSSAVTLCCSGAANVSRLAKDLADDDFPFVRPGDPDVTLTSSPTGRRETSRLDILLTENWLLIINIPY
jgi:hypothetical protein